MRVSLHGVALLMMAVRRLGTNFVLGVNREEQKGCEMVVVDGSGMTSKVPISPRNQWAGMY